MQLKPSIKHKIGRLRYKLPKKSNLLLLSLVIILLIWSLKPFSQEEKQIKKKVEVKSYGNIIRNPKLAKSETKIDSLDATLTELLNFQPKIDKPEKNVDFANTISPDSFLDYEALDKSMIMSETLQKELQSKHSKVLNYLNSEAFVQPNNYKSHGAVIVGGVNEDATWLALLAVRMFRRNGGHIPVEVMIPTREDYRRDKEICDKYLRELNANCYILEDRINLKRATLPGAHFIKILENIKIELAILSSSFDNVLYLKSDVLILKPVKGQLFDSDLFKQNGLLFWNSEAKRLTSPTFYKTIVRKISDIVGSNKGLPLPKKLQHPATTDTEYHDLKDTLPYRQTTDSMILIRKSTHFKALILSLFYNLYGPNFYYPLLSVDFEQNAPSKNTLLTAAYVLNLPFYQTNVNVETMGFQYIDKYQKVGEIFFDPINDIDSFNRYVKHSINNSLSWKGYQTFLTQIPKGKSAIFLEMTTFKLKPVEMFSSDLMFKANGDRVKLFDTRYVSSKYEIELWKIMNDYICNYEIQCAYLNRHFGNDTRKRQAFCDSKIKNHIMWLSSH